MNTSVELSSVTDAHDSPSYGRNEKSNRLMVRAIWIYFLLLIFEGGLRKWILPGLATPLLVIRDPLAIWLIYHAWKRGIFPSTIYLYGMVVIGLVGIYTACFVGHGNLAVALFGARILLLHYPLIFVLGKTLTRDDILKMGKFTLYLSVPMVMLICAQFYSPQTSFVNRGVGGDMAGAGFSGDGEYFRPPATFSFTNGTSLFFGWAAPFVFYFWLNSKNINKLLLIAASISILAAIPFAISRTLFFEVSVTLVFTLLATLRKPEYVGKIVFALITGVVIMLALSQTSFFQKATGAFTNRFDSANTQEGGLVKGVIGDRFLGGLVTAVSGSSKIPFFGYGMGMGTNVGSILLTGKTSYLISELEWGRLIGEMGPLMGLMAIFIRVGLTLQMSIQSYKKMIKGDLLAWLLVSYGFIILAQGQWAQPTSLGFTILIGGVILAAIRTSGENQPDTEPLS